MAVVETERHGQILVVRMNRPERLNALSHEMRTRLAETWTEFRRDNELEVAIFTGAGRAFCAGEDMKELLQHGAPGGRRPAIEDPFMSGALGEAGHRRGQRLCDGRRLHAGRAHRSAGRRAGRGLRGVGGKALAARRLQSWAHRKPALPDRDGDGARLPLHRRALLRDRLSQSPGGRRPVDPERARDGRASVEPCRRPRASTPSI